MPKPMEEKTVLVPKPTKEFGMVAPFSGVDWDPHKYVTLADATRYANELAAEKVQELKDALYEPMKWHSELFANLQKQIEFGQKFAANPGVVTRAEFEDLKREAQRVRLDSISILNGELWSHRTLDLRGKVQTLLARIENLEQEARSRGVMLP